MTAAPESRAARAVIDLTEPAPMPVRDAVTAALAMTRSEEALRAVLRDLL